LKILLDHHADVMYITYYFHWQYEQLDAI
jgi:hypothetical protein